MGLTEDQVFDRKDFSDEALPKGDYELCRFEQCMFGNADLSDYRFIECTFTDCDLSGVILKGTALQDVTFQKCKLMGVHFEDAKPFLLQLSFSDCILDLSSFFRLKLKGTRFSSCRLHEVDFVETELSGAVFEACDLSGAVFENTLLEKADFRTAINYSIDPEQNYISQARFALPEVVGLLGRYDIDITQ